MHPGRAPQLPQATSVESKRGSGHVSLRFITRRTSNLHWHGRATMMGTSAKRGNVHPRAGPRVPSRACVQFGLHGPRLLPRPFMKRPLEVPQKTTQDPGFLPRHESGSIKRAHRSGCAHGEAPCLVTNLGLS
jgi:hypothetical protein